MKILKLLIIITFLFISLSLFFRGIVQAHSEEEHTNIIKGDELTFYTEMKGKALSFILKNQDGAPVRLEDFRGKIVMMTFIYTRCTVVCPILEAKFLRVQDILADKIGKELILISVTVDPERDTPEVLKKHAKLIGAAPSGWEFLTGAREDIDRVLNAYKIRYEKDESGEYSHTNRIIIIDKEGNLAYKINGLHYPNDVLTGRIKAVLERSGK